MNFDLKASLKRAKQRSNGHASRIGVSLLTQAISSATNFAMGLFLVRALSPDGYGLYGVGMGAALLYLGVGNALFLTQMIVNSPSINEKDRENYFKTMLSLTFYFNAFSLVSSIAISLLIFKEIDTSPYFLIATTFAAFSLLINAFFVRYLYVVKRENIALRMNLVTSACNCIGLFVASWMHDPITPEIGLIIYGFGQVMGAIHGYIASRLQIDRRSINVIANQFSQSFANGKWALWGVTITWVQSQSYIYITGLTLGSSSIALLNAGKIIVTPFNLLLPAISNLILPYLSEARVRGNSELSKKTTYFGAGLIVLGIIYVGLILLLGPWMIPLLVGPAYEPHDLIWISLGWCGVLVLQLSTSAASLGLQASLQFKSLSLVNSVTALVTVISSVPLINLLGPIGSIAAIGIGEGLLGIALWIKLWRSA